ncbi:MAG TPA: WG repeat-containing protein [Gillisia sp.]|nr:WG repeat-containing protein [Gillisia sp.]
MKHLFSFSTFFLFSICLSAQSIEGLSIVSPLQQGYISVQKNNLWGILDSTGVMAIAFRNDLIYNENPTTQTDIGVASIRFPILSDDRTIIRKDDKGIAYYGFIDSRGTVVIEPRFLNASPFKDGKALVLQIDEQFLGRNDLLDITIRTYSYDVVLIDKAGNVLSYVAGPFPVAVSKEKLRTAPPVEAKWVGKNLIAVKTPDKKWKIQKI